MNWYMKYDHCPVVAHYNVDGYVPIGSGSFYVVDAIEDLTRALERFDHFSTTPLQTERFLTFMFDKAQAA